MSPSPEQVESLRRGFQLEARVTAPTWEIGLSALVQDFTPGEVILLLDDQIEPGTHITVQINDCSFAGDILFCAPRGSRYEAHVTFDDVDATGLRRTPRFPVSIPARVFSLMIDPLEGSIVDVSGEGLVRHCRKLPSGVFRAGVQLHHIVGKDPDLEKASAESGWMNKLGARFGRKKAERPRGWS